MEMHTTQPEAKLRDSRLFWRDHIVLFSSSVFRFLLKVINLQIKGDFEWASGEDWVQKANSLAPAAFSELFDGEPDPSRQRISRDLKLMDAVFAMGLAAYARTFPANPWAAASDPAHPDANALAAARAVQKLVHVALQRMCAANPESQLYFGRRASAPLGAGAAAHVQVFFFFLGGGGLGRLPLFPAFSFSFFFFGGH